MSQHSYSLRQENVFFPLIWFDNNLKGLTAFFHLYLDFKKAYILLQEADLVASPLINFSTVVKETELCLERKYSNRGKILQLAVFLAHGTAKECRWASCRSGRGVALCWQSAPWVQLHTSPHCGTFRKPAGQSLQSSSFSFSQRRAVRSLSELSSPLWLAAVSPIPIVCRLWKHNVFSFKAQKLNTYFFSSYSAW